SAMTKVLSLTENWTMAQRYGIKLSLIEGRSYNILFWAHCSSNTAYTVTDDGKIAIDYTDYLEGGFSMMEEMDAFYFVDSMTIGNNVSKPIGMKRPFAQVNFADKTTNPVTGTHKAVVTYHNIPSAFNPFSGDVAMADKNDTADDVQFTFTDFPAEQLTTDTGTYNYVASNYLFAPTQGVASLWATLQLQLVDGTPVNSFEFKADDNYITLQQNMKTNVVGNIVEQPQAWSVWDGSSRTMPHYDTVQNRYVIDEASKIAWLGDSASTLNANSTFVVTKDIDMAAKSNLSAISWPEGTTFNGDSHTIKGLRLNNAFFSDATNLKVNNLTIDDAIISMPAGHVGVLVNTLKGNSEFNNVTISNSSAITTDGAAGGFAGYISRKELNNRAETLSVTFDNCHVTETTIDGTYCEGHFVGLLRGYDNGEILQFNSNCTLTLYTTARSADILASPYREGNEGVWLASNDYSKYNGWLGNEECYRGTVMYGDKRFIPCWDGTTNNIVPLKDGTTNLIYSAFDLAYFQGKAAGNIKLMENVCMEYDLDGASKDGTRNHIFTALSTLTTLEGNGKTIYNISIRDNYYGGFVKNENCASTFKDVTFDGADIRVTHDAEEGNAYVGTLRGFAYASTTINNVHVMNGYLNGVCKMGGLCGGIFAKITCSNSSVYNYKFENYNSKIIDELGLKANGEIGGLIGFITVLNASTVNEISNCSVQNNSFNCVTYSAPLWDRSVAPFIGDIRTQQAGSVIINNCEILGVNTYTNASNGKTASFDQHRKQTGGSWLKPTYTYYPLVGQCYAVLILDKRGKVYIDNTQIF
ncbi:MAG: hypothetical protein IJZ17_01585, partial [Muribaculaceae bacterium]|nr:hypothetical protein [Muribaculaceae bacterium]